MFLVGDGEDKGRLSNEDLKERMEELSGKKLENKGVMFEEREGYVFGKIWFVRYVGGLDNEDNGFGWLSDESLLLLLAMLLLFMSLLMMLLLISLKLKLLLML